MFYTEKKSELEKQDGECYWIWYGTGGIKDRVKKSKEELREDVRIMSNLGEGVEERAIERTREKVTLNMHKKGYTLDQIADVNETSVDVIKAIIDKKKSATA